MAARILVIDDDRGVVDVVVSCFELEGHVAVGAFGALEGLAAFGSGSFDLVLTDYRMPDLDGLETARRIKALRPSQRVVMVTGHLERGLKEEAALIGIEAVLEKPLPLDALVALVAAPARAPAA